MRENRAAGLILGVFLILSVLGISGMVAPYGDNAAYIILGKSISQGKGLSYDNLAGIPKVGPLYPALLAGIISVAGYNYILLCFSSVIFTVLALGLFYLCLKDMGITGHIRLLILALAALNQHTLEYSRVTLTEAPFLLLSICVLFFLCRWEKLNTVKFPWGGFFAALLAFLIRDAGILLILSIGLVLLIKKQRRMAGYVFSAIVLLLLGWIWRQSFFPGGYLSEFLGQGNYLRPVGDYLTVPALLKRYGYETFVYAADIIPDFIFPYFRAIPPRSPFWLIKIAAAGILISIIVRGGIKFCQLSRLGYPLVFLCVYLVSLPLFPTYGVRYLFPVGFLLIIFFVHGLLFAVVRKKYLVTVLIGLIIFSYISFALSEIKEIKGGFSSQYRNYYRALVFLRSLKPGSKAVITRKPSLAYLVSGHHAIGYPYLDDPAMMLEFIIRSNARYLIVDNLNIAGIFFSQRYLNPVVRAYPDNFRLVYRLKHPLTEIYQIKQ